MSSLSQIQTDLEEAQSVRLVAQALGELSAIKLKGTRAEVQQNTLFFNEVANIYHQIKMVSARRNIFTHKPTQTTKNGKTVSVLLTSNLGFFGGLDSELTQIFINTTKQYPSEKIVVGKLAQTYLTDVKYHESYEFLQFDKDLPNQEELKTLIDKTINYSKILLYHTKFVTILKQEPEISDISQSGTQEEVLNFEFEYIIEPEINKMLAFFEGQILTLLYKAVLLESELSKTAARMVSMYEAEDNADRVVANYRRDLARAKRSIENTKILETYSGIRDLLNKLED